MIRLTELVEKLVDCFDRTGDPDPAIRVQVYLPDGTKPRLAVELVGLDNNGRDVVLVALLEPQAAGEPGAGNVADESDVELDVDVLLDVATGERGCDCREGVCKSNGRYSLCRDRLAAELRDRQRRERDECRDISKR